MSLHFIGIRDFPVLHRQFSSPNVRLSESPIASTHNLARDSKDVLVQRLNDLANRLVAEEALKDDDFTALHIDLDRMEKVVKNSVGARQAESSHGRKIPSSISVLGEHDDDLFWGPPFSPSRKVTMRLPDTLLSTSHYRLQRSLAMSPENVAKIAQEAATLDEQLSNALQELQARREESNHIHHLLVARAEMAAQRISELESQIQDFDADFEACQSDLSFLRLQLRAIEVQGSQYIPFDADEELTESIKNWKRDWADIDQRTRAKRKKCKDVLAGTDDSQTLPMNGSH